MKHRSLPTCLTRYLGLGLWPAVLLLACSSAKNPTEPVSDPPATPDQLVADDGVSEDSIGLSWSAVPTAETYSLYKSLDSVENEYRLFAQGVATTSYVDQTITAGRLYFYRVSAVNAAGESDPSNADMGFAGQVVSLAETPSGVQASQGELGQITIHWDSSIGADFYTVYRSDFPYGPFAALLTEIETTEFEDQQIEFNVHYFYRVSAHNQFGESSPSQIAEGFAQMGPPSGPTNLEASDGLFRDRVLLSWDEVPHADSYDVYRAPEGSQEFILEASELTAPEYEDYTVAPDTVYLYRVSAVNAAGESDLSEIESGFASSDAPDPPAQVQNVQASQDRVGHILVQWSEVENADHYRIYRAESELAEFVQLATEITQLSYEDHTLVVDEDYFYRVTALNQDGESRPSETARGYVSAEKPAVVEQVQASDGTFVDHVSIEFATGDDATSYSIYRSQNETDDYIQIASQVESPPYDDYSTELGVSYFYKVSAVNGSAESELSDPDSGYADLGVPEDLTLSNSEGHWDMDLSWKAVTGADSYNIYRKVNILGQWQQIKSGVTATVYTDEFGYLAQLYYRVSAVASDYEGQQCAEVNRWTAY